MFLAVGLTEFKRNQAWHSSEVIGAKREQANFENGGEVKRLYKCTLALTFEYFPAVAV